MKFTHIKFGLVTNRSGNIDPPDFLVHAKREMCAVGMRTPQVPLLSHRRLQLHFGNLRHVRAERELPGYPPTDTVR